MTTVRSMLLLHKRANGAVLAASRHVAEWLAGRGVGCRVLDAESGREDIRAAASGCDAVLVLGGDGTMLGAARHLHGLGVPLLGINFGRVGFLNELPAESWEEGLASLLGGGWLEESHIALQWSIGFPGSTPRAQGIAINDVVLAHGMVARTVAAQLTIDGVPFSLVRGDGLIIGTPLGSTAYTASAGGPLAMPSLNAMLLTPICPFSGGFSPLVLPCGSHVRLDDCAPGNPSVVSVDGQEDYPLEPGEMLEVTSVDDGLRMLVSSPDWYLRRLLARGIVARTGTKAE